jgi:hypothetical protein
MKYKFICDDFEGISYVLEFLHEKEYTFEEFSAICYDVLKEHFSNELASVKESADSHIALSPDSDKLTDIFKNKGFTVPTDKRICFCINPYSMIWDKDPGLADLGKKVEDFNSKCDALQLEEFEKSQNKDTNDLSTAQG